MPDQQNKESKLCYRMLPLHEMPWLSEKLCQLINSEWERSYTARFRSLNTTSENFPVNLVLINEDKDVIGHCKLSMFQLYGKEHPKISGPAALVQSVLIRKDHRRQGLGKLLMKEAEWYLKKRKINFAYLTTEDQQIFYSNLGYTECSPFDIFNNAIGFEDCKIEEPKRKINSSDRQNEKSFLPPPPPPPPLPPQPSTMPVINKFQGTKTFMMKVL